MNSIKTLLLGISIVASTSVLNAQSTLRNSEPTHISETSKMYSYRFTGKLTPTEIETLKTDVRNMEFVKEVKVEYKAEKTAGLLRLITIEKFTSTDSPFQFNILGLKELLLSKNLFPEEYESEIVYEK